ncbi:MAG TPA: hypothetical protein VKE24_05600 [Candidatus Acidoferrales bacterium]|nr:hypothetical protein [Candidatus Acidoferrales bacterium]
MKLRISLRPLVTFSVLVVSVAAAAALPQQQGAPLGKVLLSNDRVEVVEGILTPGQAVGMHRHTLAAVVLFLEGATIKEELPDGHTEIHERKPGEVVWREAGFEHNEANVGKSRMRVVVVQLK